MIGERTTSPLSYVIFFLHYLGETMEQTLTQRKPKVSKQKQKRSLNDIKEFDPADSSSSADDDTPEILEEETYYDD